MAEYLPLAFQILGLLLKWAGAKYDTLAAFQKLVEASHDEGLISVKTKDVFVAQQQAMMDLLNPPPAPKPKA